MIPELGHYALVLALGLALVQAIVPLWGARTNDATLMGVAGSTALAQFVFTAAAFAALTAAYVCHFYREGQRVIGAGKDAVLADSNLMEVNARRGEIEAHWLRVAEEMHFVTTRGKFHSKRGRENAAAADKRKASDADPQRSLVHYSPAYALSASEMSARGTYVISGASASFRYWRSPAPCT